jgi:Major Facilitator Superfamily
MTVDHTADPAERERLYQVNPPLPRQGDQSQRGVLALLAAATAIASTGLAAGGTSGALLGTRLAGSAGAGLPLGLLVVGSAAAALLISRQAARGHRGRGIMLGYLLGMAGAVVVIGAAIARSLPLLLTGSTVLGAANAAIFLTRYAAAETSTSTRGRALGIVFGATAIGAVISPLLLGPSGDLAQAAGLPRLSGLYLVAVVTFAISALLFAGASNARVPWLGRASAVLAGSHLAPASGRAVLAALLSGARTRVALIALAATNFIMAGMMAVAPVDMMMHGQGLELIGFIIALHVGGMFGPAPVSGYLADRLGPVFVIMLGGVLLLCAGLAGMAVNLSSSLEMASQLAFLGIGWNCGVVGGSALLTGGLPDAQRPQAEGAGEVTMGLAAAFAAPAAGVIAALAGYRAFAFLSVVIAVCALVAVYRSRHR